MELADRTVLITGVGGFVGRRVAERALERGLRVRGVERSHAAAAGLAGLDCDLMLGDVGDRDLMARACQGVDAVVHTAAEVSEAPDWALARRVNVEGTRQVLDSARRGGVGHLLHLSSVMVYGFRASQGVREGGRLDGAGNAYCQTKLESDLLAMQADDPAGMRVTVFRAGDIYGPGSRPWVLRPLALLRRRLFALPDGGRAALDHLHVDNLIDAFWASLERGVAGRAFNLSDGADSNCSDFFGYYARMLGRDRVPTAPYPLLRGLCMGAERVAAWRGDVPVMREAALAFLRRHHRMDISRAREELGYRPRIGLREGMARLQPWLSGQGLI